MELVSPRMDNSKGHDIFADAAGLLLQENGINYHSSTLKPQSPTPLTGLGWRVVEAGKQGMSHLTSQRAGSALLHMAGEILRHGAGALRNSDFFTDILLADYRAQFGEELPERIISSHYLAFNVDKLDGAQGVYIGPDLVAHPALLKSLERLTVRVLSPCGSFTQSTDRLMRQSSVAGNRRIASTEIINSGTIIPEQAYASIEPRLARLERINEGRAKHRAFINIGASGPERNEVITAIDFLMQQGAERISVVCGTDRTDNNKFRSKLETKYRNAPQLRLYGAQPGYNRETELLDYFGELFDQENTLCITRPNETLLLAASMAYKVLLLAPYQIHEQEGHDIVTSNGYAQTLGSALQSGISKFDTAAYMHSNWIKPALPGDALKYLTE